MFINIKTFIFVISSMSPSWELVNRTLEDNLIEPTEEDDHNIAEQEKHCCDKCGNIY